MSSPKRFQPKVLLIYLVILAVVLALWNTQPNLGLSQKFYTVSELMDQIKSDEASESEWEGVMKPNPAFGREGYTIEGTVRSLDSLSELSGSGENNANESRFLSQGRLTEEDFYSFVVIFKKNAQVPSCRIY